MEYSFKKLPTLIHNKLYSELVKSGLYKVIVRNYPRLAVEIKWRAIHNKSFPWNNPQTLDEKITWLQINTDTTKWTQLADKWEVRKYVEKTIGQDYLVPCYGIWDNVGDIDFEKLPNQFVIRCTHDCGSTFVIKDKSNEDLNALKNKLLVFQKKQLGYSTFEPHYTKIKPRIMAEKYLDDSNCRNFDSSSLIDYKIWCLNGEAYLGFICYDRHREADGHFSVVYDLYSLNPWAPRREYLSPDYSHQNFKNVPEPKNLKQMIICAEKLSNGFPEARVDFYNIDGKIYFGEITLTSAAVNHMYFSDELKLMMGKRIKLAQR